MIVFEIEERLAELSSTGGTAKLLTLTSWNNKPAKLDLRTWYTKDGIEQPSKGMTLTDAEARALADAIYLYLESK